MKQTIISFSTAALETENRKKYEELLALDKMYGEKLDIANSLLGRAYFRLRKFQATGAPQHIIANCEKSIEKYYAKVVELDKLKEDNYAELIIIPDAIDWENERLYNSLQ